MTQHSSAPSRRTFLARITLLGGAAFLASRGGAQAQAQMAQSVAHYQDKPKGDQKCAGCRFFKAPNACQLVQGTISPDGWCSFFNAKSG